MASKRPFTHTQRIFIFLGVISCFVLALSLIIRAGLPQRSDYTGQIIDGVGRVAPEIGFLAPPLQGDTLYGQQELNPLALQGKPFIINFWATWCTPCIVEMPALQDLHEELGIKIIAVNLGEDRYTVQEWIENNGITFDILIDQQMETARAYHLRGQPSTYVVTADGIISHIFYGAVALDELRAAINEAT